MSSVLSDSPPGDSYVDVLAPVAAAVSSLINPFNNLMSKKRKQQDYYCQKSLKLVAQEDTRGLANKLSLLSVDEAEKKEKKRKVSCEPVIKNYITNELERFIMNEMDGRYTKLLIQKLLNRSDINKQLNRLSLPIEHLEAQDFLNAQEKKDLEEDKKTVEVRLVGPRLQMHDQPMVLSRSGNNYVLKSNWNSFVIDNKDDLKEDAKVQVWSFRRDLQLCFAVVVVERAHVVNKLIGDLGPVSFFLSLSDE